MPDITDETIGEVIDEPTVDPTIEPTDWRADLDPTIKESPSLMNFKSKNDAVKAYVDAQAIIGRKGIPQPNDENDKEGYNMMWNKLGRPESADKYELPKTEVDEMFPEEYLKGYKETAHSLGLTQKQIDGLYKWNADSLVGQKNVSAEQQEKSRYETEKEMRKEWGNAYNDKLSLASTTFKQFADDKDMAVFTETNSAGVKLGDDPRLLRIFAKIGDSIGEDGLKGAPKRTTITPEEAQSKIAQLKMHPALTEKNHPEHNIILKQWTDLHAVMHG